MLYTDSFTSMNNLFSSIGRTNLLNRKLTELTISIFERIVNMIELKSEEEHSSAKFQLLYLIIISQ